MTCSELILCFCKPSKTHTLISSLKLLGRRLLHFVIKHSVLWRFDFKISSPHYNFGAKLRDLPDKSLIHPVWCKTVFSVWSNHLPVFSPTLSPIGSYTCVSLMCPYNLQVCVHRVCDSTALPSWGGLPDHCHSGNSHFSWAFCLSGCWKLYLGF